jgi:hypothetical protein
MRSPSCLRVCLSPNQLLKQSADLYEIQWGVHAIEDDIDTIIFNAVAASIQKWRTFKLLR